MVPRQEFQVFNGPLIVLVIPAYSAEGACNLAALKLGLPVHALTAKLVPPPKK